MFFQTAFTSLVLSTTLVAGHAMFQELWVNGKDQAKSCVRLPKSNSPVENVLSPNMRCNVGGSVGVAGLCEVPAGANLTVEMHQHDDRKCSDEAVGGRHFGPVMIYMCSVPDAKTATGDCSWVKIAEDTYAGTDASWGTEKLNWGCGKKAFIVPPSLKAGNYLVRAEAIALHAAQRKDGAQFYMSCYQVNVSGEGTEVLPKGVQFPGAYKNTDPGILLDIYQNQGSYGKVVYVAPGPEVWIPGSSTKGVPEVEAVPAAKPTQAPVVPETKPPEPMPEVAAPEPTPEVAAPELTPEVAAPEPTPEVAAPEPKPEVAIPAPVQPKPVQPAPVQPKPVQPAPVQPKPVQPAPVQPKPVQPAPVQPKPVQPAPVQPRPFQPAPKSAQPPPYPANPFQPGPRPHQGLPKPKGEKPQDEKPQCRGWFCGFFDPPVTKSDHPWPGWGG